MLKTVPVATTLEKLLHYTTLINEPWRDSSLRTHFDEDLHKRRLLSETNILAAAESIGLLELPEQPQPLHGNHGIEGGSFGHLREAPLVGYHRMFQFDALASLAYSPEQLEQLLDGRSLELSQRSILETKGRLNRYLRNLLLLVDVWQRHHDHADDLRTVMYHAMHDGVQEVPEGFDIHDYAAQLQSHDHSLAELSPASLEARLQDLLLATTHTRAQLQTHLNDASQRLYGRDIVLVEPTTARIRSMFGEYAPDHPLYTWAMIELTKRVITSDARLLNHVPKYFTPAYFARLHEQTVSVEGEEGRTGGKAAGVMFATPVIHREMGAEGVYLRDPHQFFVDTSISDAFFAHNDLLHEMEQMKWVYAGAVQTRDATEIDRVKDDIAALKQRILEGEFPPANVGQLRGSYEAICSRTGGSPLVVRSSSLLEDGVNAPFPGVYESKFLPNASQDPERNFADFLHALKEVYASVISSGALRYRLDNDLLSVDERMAALVQEVQGHREGDLFFPDLAGVVFSRATRAPDPDIDLRRGYVRIVVGLGTRAVAIDDHAHLLYFQKPAVNPTEARRRGRYSQHSVDVVDLKDNSLREIPVKEFLDTTMPSGLQAARLPVAFSLDKGLLQSYPPFNSSGISLSPYCDIAVAYRNSRLLPQAIHLVERVMDISRRAHGDDVDIEFTLNFVPCSGAVDGWMPSLSVVQCRLQYNKPEDRPATMPDIRKSGGNDITVLYRSNVPESNGSAHNLEYLLVVDPSRYGNLGPQGWPMVSALIDAVNHHYDNERFALAAPGRWGSVNPQLGVKVSYEQIHHARAMIEMVLPVNAPTNGSHFFQQIEARGIHIVTMHVGDGDTTRSLFPYFDNAPNLLLSDERLARFSQLAENGVCLWHIPSATGGNYLHLAMNSGNKPPQPNVLMYLAPQVENHH